MKKTIVCAMLLIAAAHSFSQQINPSQPKTREYYFQKSRNQKTIAWVLLGGGVGMMAAGTAIGVGEAAGSLFGENTNSTGSSVLLFGGIAAAGASIPFFISSAKNKGRAMSLSFREEKIPFTANRKLSTKSFPAVSLKINL
jgi:hypothetical protein